MRHFGCKRSALQIRPRGNFFRTVINLLLTVIYRKKDGKKIGSRTASEIFKHGGLGKCLTIY